MVAGPVVLIIRLNKVCTLSQSKSLPNDFLILILSHIYELFEISGLIVSLFTSIS